jgi:hypothetical protein
VRALTSSTGAVANTYTYDAYGKMLTCAGSVSDPFKYTGEYPDAETGSIYLRARGKPNPLGASAQTISSTSLDIPYPIG